MGTSSFTVLENMADLERGEAVRLTNEEERKSDNAQTCYTKEELEELANSGCWNSARKALLFLFWVVWIGAIAWSIFIVIKSPKCKPEPEQAWFTNGAVGLIEGGDPVASIQASEAGQYSAFLVAGLIPAFKNLLQAGNIDEIRKTSEELAELAKSKGSKLMFKVDLGDSGEKLAIDRYNEYFGGFFNQADGFVFTGADASVVESVRQRENKEHFLFFEIGMDQLEAVADQNGENEFFYQGIGGDVCTGVACIAKAKEVIDKTANFSNATIVDDIVETLWFGQTDENGLTSEAVLAATLPGGFIVPVVATDDADAKSYKSLIDLRGNAHSPRAINGAEITFKENSIERKFDLRSRIVVTADVTENDIGQGTEPKFQSEKSIFDIYEI